jgi:hypothetical protein
MSEFIRAVRQDTGGANYPVAGGNFGIVYGPDVDIKPTGGNWITEPIRESEIEELNDPKTSINQYECTCGCTEYEVFNVSATIWSIATKCVECGRVTIIVTE